MSVTESGVQGFLSPFEVEPPPGVGGWKSLYPYYAPFSEERRASEEQRGWFRDGMHFPEPMYPFDFITADSAYLCLGQANSRVFVVPPALGIDHRVLYGWVYMSANGVADPAEIGRRAEEFQKRAGYYFQNWDELYGRWQKKVEDEIRSIEALEVPRLPDIEDEAVVTEGRGIGSAHTLLVAYDRLLESIDRIWQYHFEFLNLGYAAYLAFYQLCKEAFPDIGDQAIAKMVSGIDVVLFRPDEELKRLARLAIGMGIAAAVKGAGDEADLRRALGETAEGRDWLSDWDSTKQPWFNYSNGNGFYHHHRSWIDDPAIPLGAVAFYIGRLEAGQEISRPLDAVVAERDRVTAEYRELLAGRRDARGVRPGPRAVAHGVPVRGEPQLLRRALVPHDVLEQGARVRRPAGRERLHRRRRGRLLPPAPRGERRACGPAPGVGGRLVGARPGLLAADRGASASGSWRRCAAGLPRPPSARCPSRSPSR